MIGVGAALAQADACGLHRFCFRKTGLKPTIKLDHEFFRAVVVHVPQTEDKRFCPRLQKAADQAHQLVARGYDI